MSNIIKKNQITIENFKEFKIQSQIVDGIKYFRLRDVLECLRVTRNYEKYIGQVEVQSLLNNGYIKEDGSTYLFKIGVLKFYAEDNKLRDQYSIAEEDINDFIFQLKPRCKHLKPFLNKMTNKYIKLRKELQTGSIPTGKNRIASKRIRKCYTDMIKDLSSSYWYYATATDYVYKLAFNMKASDIRKLFQIPEKAIAVKYLSDECLDAYNSVQGVLALTGFETKEELKNKYEFFKTIIKPIKVTVREDSMVKSITYTETKRIIKTKKTKD